MSHMLPPPVLTAAVRGVPPPATTTSPLAAATLPTLPPPPPAPQHLGPPAPSLPPSPLTSMRILSNMSRAGLPTTQRNRYVLPLVYCYRQYNVNTISTIENSVLFKSPNSFASDLY